MTIPVDDDSEQGEIATSKHFTIGKVFKKYIDQSQNIVLMNAVCELSGSGCTQEQKLIELADEGYTV